MTDPRIDNLVVLLDEKLNATAAHGAAAVRSAAEAIIELGHYDPVMVNVDAAARSLAGLSERLWALAVADDDPSVNYYREQAIHAIAAAVADQPAPARRDVMKVARNIVNVIGDTYYERLPHPDWVSVRQATNDQLDDFTAGLIATVAPSPDVDKVARAIAAAANADYWVGEIAEWEALEDWEREAHPENEPSMAFEDREWFRRQARAAIAAQGLTS